MVCQKKYVLYMHCLHNYWFYFENEQKNYPQVYLEECKNKIKKIHTSRFINIELETNSESDVETYSELDTTELRLNIDKIKCNYVFRKLLIYNSCNYKQHFYKDFCNNNINYEQHAWESQY